MNRPPEEHIRVPHQKLHTFVSTAVQTVGLPENKADLLAEMLTGNDLRGVFSHGTQQVATYAILMRDGKLNNVPDIKVVQETPVSLLVDGDGGLGYFPAHEGTLRAIEKAKAQGIAIMVSRNHGHFGAAGLYSRLTLGHDLATFVTSGAQRNLTASNDIYAAVGGSPMSFSAPTDQEDPMVLDFGTMHDMQGNAPIRDDLARLAPGVVFRSIGLGAFCQVWGGLLAGLPADGARAERSYPGATQGALVITFQIELFLDPAQFKREMDEYVRTARTLKPVVGFDEAYLPGGPEAASGRKYREEGVPVGKRHQERLERLAEELKIELPW